MASSPTPAAEAKAEAKPAPSSGGFKAWLPLVLSVLLMPAVAYAMTMFVLLPKLKQGMGAEPVQARESAPGESGHGEAGKTASAASRESAKPKFKVPVSKVIVNVSGSLGTRMLLSSFTLAGSHPEFKTLIEEHTDQLRDLAASTLSSKTITDLEKPEARNLIRAELLSQFNASLGASLVQEIYITEFAIQ